MRVFITGATGQLGSAIVSQFADCDLVCPSHTDVDLGDTDAVRTAITTARPDVIVNCAAYNHVDAAEDYPLDALKLNAFAVNTLARAAHDLGATLVHYGSDFVFDGTASEPYDEMAQPAPQSLYGASKLLGEWIALAMPRAYVLRVQSLFGTPRGFTGRAGSMENIVRALEAGREVAAFNDRIVTPGYVPDIAAATRHLVDSNAAPGLYHCANEGPTRWTDLAEELASLLGVRPNIRSVASVSVSLKARRPLYSALSSAKLAAAGFAMPPWRDALKRWISARAEAPV
jgi:dTDP-4-dehydrorhamnose reductase